MKALKGFLILVGLIVAAVFAWGSTAVVVQENELVVITQFGQPVKAYTEPGLHFKAPFTQTGTYFDKRLQLYDSKETDVITRDKKTMRIDNYARWRIIDPLVFQAVVLTEQRAQQVLDDVLYSELRAELGNYDLIDIVSVSREQIHERVTKASDVKTRAYGIEIVDVRIKRADLPAENQSAVYDRMKSERLRQATQYKSEGAEEAAKIKATTDKERQIILAEAYEKAQTLRGQGEAEAIQVYNQALSQDPEFYTFIRTLEAYKKALTGSERTTLVLSPDSELLRFFKGSR